MNVLYHNLIRCKYIYTVKLLNNGPPEERPIVNNGEILIALAYCNTLLPSRAATPEFPTSESENYQITANNNSLKFKNNKKANRESCLLSRFAMFEVAITKKLSVKAAKTSLL